MKLRNLVLAGLAGALLSSTAPAAVVGFTFAADDGFFIFGSGTGGTGSFATTGDDGVFTLARGLSDFSLNGYQHGFFSFGDVSAGKSDLDSFSATLKGGALTDLSFATKTLQATNQSPFDFLSFFDPAPSTTAVKYSVSGLGKNNLTFDRAGQSIVGTLTPTTVVAAVPEPATWALMIGGFGMVGGMMRRRRVASTTVRFA